MSETSKHVVVVGAGIGGLAAAVDLAQSGLAVTVVERAARAGGKMRELCVAGRTMDVGPTVLTMRWVFDELFASAGENLSDWVTLTRPSMLARHAWPGGAQLDLFTDIERSVDAVGDFAGAAEARGYRAFCDYSRRIYEAVEVPFLRNQRPTVGSMIKLAGSGHLPSLARIDAHRTMWASLGRFFSDRRLRQLFGRYATYCGSSPLLAPGTLNLIAHVEREGVWLVEGGMYKMAEALVGLATKLGVTFRYEEEVREVGVRGGSARSLTLASGEELRADAIVLNAEPAAIARGLFGRDAARAVRAPDAEGRSLSAFTLAVVGEVSGFDLARHTVFFSPDYEEELGDLTDRRRVPEKPSVYVCAHDRERSVAQQEGASERLFMIVNAPANGSEAPWSETEIVECEQRAIEATRACGLQIKAEATVRVTPKDFERMFPASGGALYGQASHGAMAAFHRPSARTRIANLFLAGGGDAPRSGRPDDHAERAIRSVSRDRRPRFDEAIVGGGYAWFYVDAVSDCGAYSVVIIGMLGNVFSPWYARSRQKYAHSDPLAHCTMNVALHGPGKSAWALTERGKSAVHRSENALVIGASSMQWEGGSLVVRVDESRAPFGGRIRGTIKLHPTSTTPEGLALDSAGRHLWWPVAPTARVEVALDDPAMRWSGHGYHDHNAGDEPLEAAFDRWTWTRARLRGDRAAIAYDVVLKDGRARSLGRVIDAEGRASSLDDAGFQPLPKTRWRIDRASRTAQGSEAKLVRTLEDTPFYARSLVAARLAGEDVVAMHETVSLERFSRPWVRALLPFRMGREAAR